MTILLAALQATSAHAEPCAADPCTPVNDVVVARSPAPVPQPSVLNRLGSDSLLPVGGVVGGLVLFGSTLLVVATHRRATVAREAGGRRESAVTAAPREAGPIAPEDRRVRA